MLLKHTSFWLLMILTFCKIHNTEYFSTIEPINDELAARIVGKSWHTVWYTNTNFK